jgi:hypothetical protein
MAALHSAFGSRMRNFRRKVVRASWRFTPFKRFIRPVVRKTLSSRLMPGCWLRSFRLFRILNFDYGYLRSAARMRSIDAAGEPVPWITYPAIEFLKQLDLSDKTVFEYGCGGSTVFWSRAAKRVDSVEHDNQFYREVRPMLPPNCDLSLETVPERYIHTAARRAPYDIIVIDGRWRTRCSEVAPKHLKPGGFVILDNSDWFGEASQNLRDADLIEVDMAGMGPIADFVSTTSFYFHRDFRGKPKSRRQPMGAIGSVRNPFDRWSDLDADDARAHRALL